MSTVISTKTSGVGGLTVTGDASGVLQLASANGTTAVTIDASQNVGIGTSSPAFPLDISGPVANIRVAPTTTTNNALTRYVNAGGTGYVGLDSSVGGLTTAYALNIYHSGAYPITFSTSATERARIDSSGNLLVGTTTQFTGKQCIAFNGLTHYGIALKDTVDQSAARFINFANGSGTVIGAIARVSTTNAVQYLTSSDYRLKENIAPMVNALDSIAALKPCTYAWKDGGVVSQGFIAHELQSVIPECVSGEKDAIDKDGKPKYQGIDTSFLVATLTAAIQEQQTLIEALTARLTALEGVSQ